MKRTGLITIGTLTVGAALGVGVAGWPEHVSNDVVISVPDGEVGGTIVASIPAGPIVPPTETAALATVTVVTTTTTVIPTTTTA